MLNSRTAAHCRSTAAVRIATAAAESTDHGTVWGVTAADLRDVLKTLAGTRPHTRGSSSQNNANRRGGRDGARRPAVLIRPRAATLARVADSFRVASIGRCSPCLALQRRRRTGTSRHIAVGEARGDGRLCGHSLFCVTENYLRSIQSAASRWTRCVPLLRAISCDRAWKARFLQA